MRRLFVLTLVALFGAAAPGLHAQMSAGRVIPQAQAPPEPNRGGALDLASLDPKVALIAALAFPLGYGLYDFIQRQNFNFVSAIGFFGTLATGGLGLLKLQPFWFAVKEAVVPTLIGLAVVISQWTKQPMVRALLFNDQVIDVPRVEAALDERGQRAAFTRLLNGSSWLLAFSFLISAVLNFGPPCWP